MLRKLGLQAEDELTASKSSLLPVISTRIGRSVSDFRSKDRQRKMKRSFIWLMILISCILAGCAAPGNRPNSALGAIWATDVSTSIGSAGNDSSHQVISYRMTLKNGEPTAVTIHSITLLFASELDKRVLSDQKVSIENTIEPGATIELTGQVTFDAMGVSKEQIAAWGPLIKGMFATMDQSVIIQSQGQP
jgi:hypothetical protein